MKIQTLLPAFLAAIGVLAGPTPALFDLRSSTEGLPGLIWTPLMFVNGSAYVGNVKYSIFSEPLLLSGGSTDYGHSFTSIHSPPTGWRTFYTFANESKPLGFTTPHSGFVPAGAQITGYGSFGGYLKLNRGAGKGFEERWRACKVPQSVVDGTWQIYWEGGAKLRDCTAVRLKVGNATECRLPQN